MPLTCFVLVAFKTTIWLFLVHAETSGCGSASGCNGRCCPAGGSVEQPRPVCCVRVWQQRLTSRMTSDFHLGKWHVYLKCFLFSASSLRFIVVFPSWGLRWGGFHFGDGAFGTLVLSEARKQTKHVISELFTLIKQWRCFSPHEPLFTSFTATYGLKKFLKIYFLF